MPNQAKFENLIQYFKKFNPLSKAGEEAMMKICSRIQVSKNKDLQPIGYTCKTIYFIDKGIARIYYYREGKDVTEFFAAENSIIVRAESLFTGKPSRKAIQVLEDSEIVGMDAVVLFKLYDQFPEIERLFRKIFEAAYVETVNRIESIQFHSAKERYEALLLDSPDILQRVPLKHIASFLGITQVSLSRIRAQR